MEGEDIEYNKDEFLAWFQKLCFTNNACFFRDILRAKKEELWQEYKRQVDAWRQRTIDDYDKTKLE